MVGATRSWRSCLIAGAVLVLGPLVTVAQAATSGPAAAGAAVVVPDCPPDCGAVAAGDPLLVPYIALNPGPGWLALPSSEAKPYVDAIKHGLDAGRVKGEPSNVAAAKWQWVTGKFGLTIVLISSPSLAALTFPDPARDALAICASARGQPRGDLSQVPGVPHSVAGLCTTGTGKKTSASTVVAFRRGDVVTLIQITSRSNSPIDPRTVAIAAQQQFQTLPAQDVVVSSGFDIEWLVLWLIVLAGIAYAVVASIRRQRNGRTVSRTIGEAIARRRVALVVSLAAIIGAMAFSMLDTSVLHGSGQWFEASFNDFWRNWADGSYMVHGGGLSHIYLLDPSLETAPALQVLIAPIAHAAFGLPFPYPSPVLYPAAYWVAGPLFLAAMVLPICAADRWLELMAVDDIRRRLAVLATMAIVLPPIALFGHPEDLITLGAVLYGLVAALEGHPRAVGWWFGVALAFQFLAFLAIPLALVFVKRRDWLRSIIPMIAVPLVFLVIPLIGEPSVTIQQLLHQKVYDDLGYITPTWNLDPGVAAFIRIVIALAAVPAAVVVARLHLKRGPNAANAVVWTLGVLFALRVFEPELVPYFLAPTLALFPLSASRKSWWWLGGACLLAVWLNWWLHVAVDARWSLWLLLIGQLAVLGWLAWPVRTGRTTDVRAAERGDTLTSASTR